MDKLALSTKKGLKAMTNPVAMSAPRAQSVASKCCLPLKNKQTNKNIGSWRKSWLCDVGQKRIIWTLHVCGFLIPRRKLSRTIWPHQGTQEPAWRGPDWPKMGQFAQQWTETCQIRLWTETCQIRLNPWLNEDFLKFIGLVVNQLIIMKTDK